MYAWRMVAIHTSMHQSLTCGLVFHANQYSTENCYDDEEKYCGTSHQHPNDDRSLHTMNLEEKEKK